MTSKGKKRKLEESKELVRGSKEHLNACWKGLIVAASKDPKGWLHLGKEKPNGGVEVLDSKETQLLYLVPDDIPPEILMLVGTALRQAKDARATPDLRVVCFIDTGELLMKGDQVLGLADFLMRWMDEASFEAAKRGKWNTPASDHITYYKFGEGPGIGLKSLK